MESYKAKLLKKEKLTEDVLRFSFTVPEKFEFEAGQFVNIKCCNGKDTKRRSYSILNPPSQKETLDICVKIINGGFASDVFVNSKVGDEFEIVGPMGHFVFDEESKDDENWFLCAGTGVTPFYSVLKEFVSKYSDKRFVLLFGVRTQKNLFFHEEFKALEEKYPNFEFRPVLSKEDWEGLKGHIQDHLPDNIDNKMFYICGLKELVLDTEEKLLNKGIKKEKIKKERYS